MKWWWTALRYRRCLTGIDFSSLWPWDAQPQIQRNHFAGGECGWANWLLVPCGSPRCEEQKSRARSGVGRPRQDRLGPHAVTTSMPLTNTSLDNLPTRDSAKPVWAQGEESGHKGAVSDQGLEPLHGCVQLHHTECFMKVCSLPNNIYQTFLCCLSWWLGKNNYKSCMQINALLINKKTETE